MQNFPMMLITIEFQIWIVSHKLDFTENLWFVVQYIDELVEQFKDLSLHENEANLDKPKIKRVLTVDVDSHKRSYDYSLPVIF